MRNIFPSICSLHIPPFLWNDSSHSDANISKNGCPFHLHLCCCDHFFSGSQKTSVMSKTRAWGRCRSSGPAFSADRSGTKTGIPIKMKTRKWNSCQNATTVKHGWILLLEKEPLTYMGIETTLYNMEMEKPRYGRNMILLK